MIDSQRKEAIIDNCIYIRNQLKELATRKPELAVCDEFENIKCALDLIQFIF